VILERPMVEFLIKLLLVAVRLGRGYGSGTSIG
jgi:hypothetical protein